MKKLALLLMLSAFVFASCGGEATKAESTGPAVDAGEVKTAIVGLWEAEDLGEVLAGFGFAKPTSIEFSADGKYIFKTVIGGTAFDIRGDYVIVDTASKPMKIDFNQKTRNGAAAEEEAAGIFEVTADGKFKTIFYRKAFLPRATSFGDDDTQVYKKVK